MSPSEPPPAPQWRIKGQGHAEEDLHHLHYRNGGWQQRWLAMVADGGGNGLVAGDNKKGVKTNHSWLFWGTLHRTGAMLVPILPMLQHLPQYALCHSIET